MRTFIINLKEQHERKKAITELCDRLGMKYDVVDAVNGKMLASEIVSAVTHNYPASQLTRGEIGCALSHLHVYAEMIANDIPYALILEDDAVICAELLDYLQNIKGVITASKPEVFLLTGNCQYNRKIKMKDSRGYAYYRVAHGSTSHGYIITLSAAKQIQKHNLPVKYEADRWMLFRDIFGLRVWCSKDRLICSSDTFNETSTLEKERRKTKKRRGDVINQLKKSMPHYQVKRIKNLLLNKTGLSQ